MARFSRLTARARISGKKKGSTGVTRLPLFELCFRLLAERTAPGHPLVDDPGNRPLFGGFRHGVDRHIFAAKLAIVESDLALGGCEQRVVLAHANVDTRVNLGAALTHDNVAADHFLTAELLHAKAAAG